MPSPRAIAVAGGQFFFGKGQCSTCHMVGGRGKVNGPDLSDIGRKSTVRELELVLDNPTSQMGIHTTPTCPSWAFCPDEAWAVVNVHLRNGSILRGFARNRAEHDLQLQTFDGKMHLLTDADYQEIAREKESFMPPLKATAEERRNLIAYLSSLGGNPTGPPAGETEPVSAEAIDAVMKPKAGEWPTYNGVPGGNRYSPLNQINTAKRPAIATGMGLRAARARPRDDAAGQRRRDVRHRAGRGVRPRRAQRPRDLVLRAFGQPWKPQRVQMRLGVPTAAWRYLATASSSSPETRT